MQILRVSLSPEQGKEPANVRELIDHLKEFPQNLKVYMGSGITTSPVLIDNVELYEK